jgi:septum formation protein
VSYQQICVTRLPLLLASASPRRREILERAGIPILVDAQDVDEAELEDEPLADYLDRVTRAKLTSACRQRREVIGVLAADTVVNAGGISLGKPNSDRDAMRMIERLSNSTHEVTTRFCLAEPGGVVVHAESVVTQVTFRALSSKEIARYVATGEGRDKAGAYAIQGIGAFLVERISGSFTNVVGLPIAEVVRALVRCRLISDYPFLESDG